MSLCIAELMEKENCDPDFQPPKEKAKVGINKHFAKAKGADEVAEITKGYVPLNTAKNTTRAMQVFKVVLKTRNVLVMKYVVRMY